MADQVELDPGSGGALVYVDELTVATSTVAAQRVKLLLGADGVNDGDVHSSNPLPISGTVVANIGTVSSLATEVTIGNISTYATSTNTLLVQVSSVAASSVSLASSNLLRLNTISTVANSTNTLLVNLSSNTASSVSLASSNLLRLNTISTVANSTNTMLLNMIASSTSSMWVQAQPGAAQTTISTTELIRVALYGATDNQITSFGGGTQYVQGDTTTAPTGTVMLWKSAVSTIVPVTTSLGLPVNVVAGSLNANTEYVEGDTSTAPTGIVMLWKSAVSTLRAASTSDPLPISGTITANFGATDNALLDNISTFTNSTNTLLVQVSSNTASTNALASTVAARLAPTPTGIYVQPVAVSSNGLSVFKTLDADETEEQVSATACTVYGIWVTNSSTTPAYVKLFNGTSSAVFVSSATAVMTFGVPGSSTQALTGAVLNVGGMGISFSTACCIAATTAAADGDVGAVGTSTVIANVFYKN